eukprot:2341492-Pleurochrysis_carterae.AAC.1
MSGERQRSCRRSMKMALVTAERPSAPRGARFCSSTKPLLCAELRNEPSGPPTLPACVNRGHAERNAITSVAMTASYNMNHDTSCGTAKRVSTTTRDGLLSATGSNTSR